MYMALRLPVIMNRMKRTYPKMTDTHMLCSLSGPLISLSPLPPSLFSLSQALILSIYIALPPYALFHSLRSSPSFPLPLPSLSNSIILYI